MMKSGLLVPSVSPLMGGTASVYPMWLVVTAPCVLQTTGTSVLRQAVWSVNATLLVLSCYSVTRLLGNASVTQE